MRAIALGVGALALGTLSWDIIVSAIMLSVVIAAFRPANDCKQKRLTPKGLASHLLLPNQLEQPGPVRR